MDFPKRCIKEGVNAVYFRPRVLLSYLPDDLKKTVCSSLDVESLEDDSLVFGYNFVENCYSISKPFKFVVSVKGED